ncbi:hypothetical protein MUG87_11735 [Ectobacillus sp. JY-23]|uniref:hypothetical protein n=1 Tax=Ectobacillus sp. JY-23 TaxID=2933872 RepID=UPI001FF4FDFE|nr:hypothetical protein [Ectobacillus sp. JY-23]UOY91226.1 hypothetical protein MUG87_11735 [Ectobacillus sp. JY-23]
MSQNWFQTIVDSVIRKVQGTDEIKGEIVLLPSEQSITVQLSQKEAFFLFQKMGMQELPLANPFVGKSTEEMEKEWLQVKAALIKDEILEEKRGKLAVEPVTYTLLQICKLSSVVSRLVLHGEEPMDGHYYFSSQKIVEVESGQNESECTLNTIKDFEEYLDSLGNYYIQANDTSALDMRGAISVSGYEELMKNLPQLRKEGILDRLHIENISAELAEAFASSLVETERYGSYAVSKRVKSGWETKGVGFVIGHTNNWIIVPNVEQADIYTIGDIELITYMYDMVTEAL